MWQNLWSCIHCDWCYQLVGLKILERCLDNWYVGEDTKETRSEEGLRLVSFGEGMYSRGMRPAEQHSQL